MIRSLAKLRRPMHVALAVLVVAALARCLREDARELLQRRQRVACHQAGLPAPIEAPVHDCEREYGCICRGATLLVPIDLSSLMAVRIELLSVADGCSPAAMVLDPSSAIASPLDADPAAPPISGRKLRALYASLVI